MKLHVLAALTVASLLAAGCLSRSSETNATPTLSAQSAKDAGAQTGAAPAAPTQPYEVKVATEGGGDAVVTKAYPLKIKTNAAKAPVHKEVKGTYNLTECSQFGNLNPVNSGWRQLALTDLIEPGDVFTYAFNLTFENTDQSWGDLHLYYGLGAKNEYWDQPTAEKRGTVAENFTGQGYRVSDKDPAWMAVTCWYGSVTTPLEYKVTIDFTFAQDAVPAETPFLVSVPDGAKQLLVAGVPYDAARGVLSHFRVFGPDDALVCECALSPLQQATSVPLAAPGDYVVLVDHTSGGFVSFALDVPPADSLRALATVWKAIPLFESASDSSLDKTVEIDIPTVPLVLGAYVWPQGGDAKVGIATGKALSIDVVNARGAPLVIKRAGFVAYSLQTPATWSYNTMGLPVPGEWEYKTDHHAYANGAHKVHVKADMLRGVPTLSYRTYERA